MSYFSEKNGQIEDVITAIEVAVNEDDDLERNRILEWTAKRMGLNEGPIDLDGEEICPLQIDDDYNIWVWRATTGWKMLPQLLLSFSRDAFKEDKKEVEE